MNNNEIGKEYLGLKNPLNYNENVKTNAVILNAMLNAAREDQKLLEKASAKQAEPTDEQKVMIENIIAKTSSDMIMEKNIERAKLEARQAQRAEFIKIISEHHTHTFHGYEFINKEEILAQLEKVD